MKDSGRCWFVGGRARVSELDHSTSGTLEVRDEALVRSIPGPDGLDVRMSYVYSRGWNFAAEAISC